VVAAVSDSAAQGQDAATVSTPTETELRKHYAKVCSCEWEDHGYDEVISQVSEACIIHGEAADPLDTLITENAKLLEHLEEVKRLASDPFASEAVALRACLLTAYEGLGLPGPESSPERDIAKAVIREHFE
jgi:hypothetical protein